MIDAESDFRYQNHLLGPKTQVFYAVFPPLESNNTLQGDCRLIAIVVITPYSKDEV
jgi:hypothetical protein